MKSLKQLWLEEEGQGMTEYAVVLVSIVAVLLAALVIFRGKINTYLSDIKFT